MSWLPDWLTGFDRENFEAGQAAERRSRELNEDLRRRGLISDSDYNAAVDHYDAGQSYDPDAAIEEAFEEGFEQGADNIRGFASDTINTVVGTPLKLIPWQVWIALALFVAFKLGLLNDLLKRWK